MSIEGVPAENGEVACGGAATGFVDVSIVLIFQGRPPGRAGFTGAALACCRGNTVGYVQIPICFTICSWAFLVAENLLVNRRCWNGKKRSDGIRKEGGKPVLILM
jgi:hypothetical protein